MAGSELSIVAAMMPHFLCTDNAASPGRLFEGLQQIVIVDTFRACSDPQHNRQAFRPANNKYNPKITAAIGSCPCCCARVPCFSIKWSFYSETQRTCNFKPGLLCKTTERFSRRMFRLLFCRSKCIYYYMNRFWSWDSSVGIATGYGLDGLGSILGKAKIFIFSTASGPAQRPTQPLVQWVPGTHSLAVK
jgi:streptolysin S family bacteriocin protoxin